MSAEKDARLVMETVAQLHKHGYGRLKIFCYVKEGIGAWRHWLFASDDFPCSSSDLPHPVLHGSIPLFSSRTITGKLADDAALLFIDAQPELISAALGADTIYVKWYAEMLNANPTGILQMESPFEAMIDYRKIVTPYQRHPAISRNTTH